MAAVLTVDQESLGFKARRLRIAHLLTRRELASLAGVSIEDINLFEHDLPIALDIKRKLLRQLWAVKPGHS